MIPRKPTLLAERLIVWMAIIVLTFFIGYDIGYSKAAHKPKTCAEVPGLNPISSTADTCTYIQAPKGLAFYRRKAI